MLELLTLDTETTSDGTNEQAEPIEISYSMSGMEDQFFMKPNERIMPCAAVIHGKDDLGVSLYTPIDNVIPKVFDKLKQIVTDNTVVSAYNAPFDIGILDYAFRTYANHGFAPTKVLDVLALAKKIVPIKETGNHRLDTVFYWLFPDKLKYLLKQRASHSALIDVAITEQVLMELWDKAAEKEANPDMSLEDLMEFTTRPMILDIWPWGKHKGTEIADVIAKDRSYVHWFMNKCDFRDEHPDLVHTLRTLGGD